MNSKAFLISALLFSNTLSAQVYTHQQYIQTVAQKNTAYLAERYNVDIATAQLQAARVFNDPELSVEYGNNQDWSKQMGQSVDFGLSYDLDIAGVRRSQIKLARTEKELAEASVNAYLCNLRAEASVCWAEAWRLRESCKILESSVKDMEQIADNDSIRLAVGEIARTDAMQSRLEAQTMRTELLAQQAEYQNALLNLSQLAGGEFIEGIKDTELPSISSPISLQNAQQVAETNRADLRAAELGKTLSQDNLRLVKASRAMDLGLSLGYSYNTEVRNEIAPAPKYNGLSVGVTIPLKFSSLNKGDLKVAQSQIEQQNQIYETAKLQVRTEVAQAFNSYRAANAVLKRYNGEMLEKARQVLDNRKMGYTKGENNILDLLTAQQTYNEIMQAYIQARSTTFVSQVRLQQAIGLFIQN